MAPTWMMLSLAIILLLGTKLSGATPVGCTEMSTDGVFECDYRVISLPLDALDFSTQPQHITLNAVSGMVSDDSFLNLGTAPASLPVPGKPAQLDIVCSESGLVYLSSGAFNGLDWVNVVTFTDCHVEGLVTSLFAPFVTLDRLEFMGGSVEDMSSDTFEGLTIAEDSSLSVSHGHLKFYKTELKGKRIPTALMTPIQNDVKEIAFVSCNIQLLDSDTFKNCSSLTSLDLSGNLFPYLPYGFLGNLGALTTVNLGDVPFDCSACSATWFLDYARYYHVDIEGSLVCAAPSAMINTRVLTYYYDDCGNSAELISADQNTGGLDLGGMYWSYPEFGASILVLITFVMAFGNSICLCSMKKKLGGGFEKLPPLTNSSSSKPRDDKHHGKSSSSRTNPSTQKTSNRHSHHPRGPRRPSSGRVTPSEVAVDLWS